MSRTSIVVAKMDVDIFHTSVICFFFKKKKSRPVEFLALLQSATGTTFW